MAAYGREWIIRDRPIERTLAHPGFEARNARYESEAKARVPAVVEEALEVGGVTVREGEAVYVFYPAANRDPSVYTEPDRLDLARNEAPHLAFGHGAHYCAGAQLARMEAEVMLSTLLTRFPALATAVEPERIAWRRGTVNRGPVALPVTW
ncbi:cytochrome P450 [Streptomyces gardneri]|uniref:cytochrome P450 n=1 Tax=Streptomyces gardneri TaxID=66892 RepID=UPI0035D59A13